LVAEIFNNDMIQSSIISKVVFISALLITCFSLISVIFPALIINVSSPYENNFETFELGAYSIPFLIINSSIIGFIIFCIKKPQHRLHNIFNIVLNFEISKKVTIIVGIIILSIYIGLSIPELSLNEADQWGDYDTLNAALEIWPFGESENLYVTEQKDRYVRMFLLDISYNILQNIKILPFVASILLVIVTYFFTYEISKKRFAGLVSMVILLQSYTFLKYDTIAVYENFWVLFYVLSLYVIHKKWHLSSPLWYVLSIFTKAFATPYILMNIFYVYNSQLSNSKKIRLFLLYGIAIVISIAIFSIGETIYGDLFSFDFSEFVMGFTTLAYQLRFDYLVLMTILPLIIGLFIVARKGIREADSFLVLILGSILASPILVLFTDFYVILPYRFVPLIVFFAIGVGILLSKRDST